MDSPENELKQPSQPQQEYHYAGFWLRFLASQVDGAIIVFISVIFGIGFSIISAILKNSAISMIGLLFQYAIGFGYPLYFLVKQNATPGKKILHLKVIPVDGSEKISLGRAIVREIIGKFISIIILGIGYIMAAFDSKKQALHDKIAGTVVIKTEGKSHTGIVIAILILPLVLILLLAILLAITLIAINPQRQFAQSNNTKRASDVNTILNAVDQYSQDNNGIALREIPSDAPTVIGNGNKEIDICSKLVPTYISALPTDPSLNTTSITSCTSQYSTGYQISRNSLNRITVSAPKAELGAAISITR